MSDFNEAVRVDPNNWQGFYGRGVVYYERKDFKRAIAQFNESIRLDLNNAYSFYFRGLSKQEIGDRTAAADIAKARQLDPSVGK
jgi:Flp pilus assembly protein TadD